MKKALKVALLLVLLVVVVYSGRRIADGITLNHHCSTSPEAQRGAEMVTVEGSIEALMYEEAIADLSKYADNTTTWAPVRTYEAGEATNDMSIFPSTVWHLYRELDEGTTPLTMFFHQRTMECYYTVEHDGTVRQLADAAKTVEYT